MAVHGTLNECHATPVRPRIWFWFVVYAVLSLIIQWPLVGLMTTHISYGRETEITVPLLNLWTVWWNADRAWYWFSGYWDAPIFYPTKRTFVFSEAQPISTIVAPLVWLTGSRSLAYNIYQLLILALNGFSAHCLLRRLGHIPWLAFCGGVMSQILPFVIWQSGVVQLTTLFGIYWTIHAAIDLFESDDESSVTSSMHIQVKCGVPQDEIHGVKPLFQRITSVRHALDEGDVIVAKRPKPRSKLVCVHLGMAFGLTYWLCNYWGLFLAMLLAPSSICLWNRRLFRATFWRDVAVSVVIVMVMIGPFVWLQRSLSREHDWQTARTDDLVFSLSAHVQDHTDLPWRTWAGWLEFPEAERNNLWCIGGGSLKLLLVPIGFVASLFTPGRRRWGAFALVFGTFAFGLSLGPTVEFADGIPLLGKVCPYKLLQQYVVGFSLIRSPFRFAVFVQLAAVWLSIEAFDLLNPRRWIRGDRPILIWSWIPLVLVSASVTLEAVPPPPNLYPLPSPQILPVWVTWLRDSAEPSAAVACLPFPFGNQVGDYEQTTLWMYWGTFHGKPLLNGYSGFFPNTYNNLRDALELFVHPRNPKPDEPFVPQFKDYGWDSPGLQMLNESGARYVVVKRSFGTQDDVVMHAQARFRWALVVSDEIEKVDIYELPLRESGEISSGR